MPKEGKQKESEIIYRGPTSGGRPGKYRLRLTWGNPYMEYKKRRWKKFYFKNVVSWEAFPQGYNGKMIDTKWPPRFILITAVGRTTEEREFAVPRDEFNDWLYLILRAVMKYSKATIPDKYLSHLPPEYKQKLTTRLRLRRFDMSHKVFVAVAEGIDAGITAKERAGDIPVPKGFHPLLVEGPKVYGRTRGGVAYGKVERKIGSGGSNTVIFKLNQLLQPIIKRDSDGSFKNIERPVKPMAVKVPKYNHFDEGQDYKDLVREARALASIGQHRNIIGLIDAQLLSRERLYLFMERGDHDMDGFSLEKPKDKRRPLPSLPLIRKYAEGILAGIAYMNQQRIYHLDMKPANVLICDNTPKIIDFGLARARALDSRNEMLEKPLLGWKGHGTVVYQAPERWTDGAISNENNLAKLDSYAVGMTLFISLLGPCFGWKRPRHGLSNFKDGPAQIIPRIKHFQGKALDPKEIVKLKKKGLLYIAQAASGLIDEDPDNRLFVEHALELARGDLERMRKRRRMVNRDAVLSAQVDRNLSNPSRRRPASKTPSFKCRNCKRTFTYKPMRCGCGTLVHPDGHPLFITV